MLKEGVRIHGERAPSDLQPFHENMLSQFQELKANVEKNYGKRVRFCSHLSNYRPGFVNQTRNFS